MHPLSGDITAPACRFFPEVGQVPELPALEEALPHVLDAPLHVGHVLGVAHPGGVGDEAPVLGVFQKAPGEPGVQRVGARHRGREVVDDQVLRTPPKKAQAASSPAMTSSSFWLKVGQTKQWRE